MSRTRYKLSDNLQTTPGRYLSKYYWEPAWTTDVPLEVSQPLSYDSVDDSPGYGGGDCLPFTVDTYRGKGETNFRLNGEATIGYGTVKIIDGPLCATWKASLSHEETLSPSDTYFATSLAASTSPSRPVVELAAALGELKDIPELFARKHFGSAISDIASTGASSRFKFRFGIAPMLQDISSMLKFTESVSKRTDELHRLFSKKGLRRTRPLGNFSGSWFGLDPNSSPTSVVKVFLGFTRSTKEEVRGHIRWVPSVPVLSPPSDETLRRFASNAVIGGGINARAAWELVPWSWMVDWFGNVGDYIAAHTNTVPATIDKIVIMRKLETVCEYSLLSITDLYGVPLVGDEFKVTTGSVSRVTKTRRPAVVGLSARLPLLTPQQMLIATDLILGLKK